MSGFEFDVQGADRAALHLHDLGERSADVRPPADRIRDLYMRSNARRFSSSPWHPLAASTSARKARQGLDPRIERATGALHRALTSAHAPGQVDERKPDELRFGSDLPYAHFQEGTSRQPVREIVKLTAGERRAVTRVISDWVVQGRR